MPFPPTSLFFALAVTAAPFEKGFFIPSFFIDLEFFSAAAQTFFPSQFPKDYCLLRLCWHSFLLFIANITSTVSLYDIYLDTRLGAFETSKAFFGLNSSGIIGTSDPEAPED